MAGFDLKSFFSKPSGSERGANILQDELDALLLGIPGALIAYDADFKVLSFNAAAERLFNLPAASVVGHVLSPRDASDPARQVLAQTIFSSLAPRIVKISSEGEWPEIYDISFTDPVLELRANTVPVLDAAGKPVIFFKIISDRTPLILALRSKNEFITVASHQLRGPMTDISWALQSLRSDATLGDTNKLIVENALAAANGLIGRIEDLLSVAKMEEGQSGYTFEDTDIVAFVGQVLAGVLPSTQKAGIKMYFDRPTAPVPHVTIDTKRLSIALTNLLENAIRYNVANGEVIVRVEQVQGQPFVEVSIKDTGIGIPAAAINNLFKKFFRADNAVASQTEGSGLGLYMAKGIVTAHGGKIWAESEVNRGTVMHFTLPTDPNLVPKHEPGAESFLL
ncbi:MAG: ATP-binding protein [Minisyncoccia bacterium]|jgi:signal transduction histidine kinase